MFVKLVFAFTFLPVLVECGIFGKRYRVAIKAKIRCHGKRYDDVILNLTKSEDYTEMPLPTTIQKRHNKTEITTEVKESGVFQPILHVIHRCDDVKDMAKRNMCPLDFAIRIPEEYVIEASEDIRFYSLTIELNKKSQFDVMKRNCEVIL
ncbi:unnamed protein product [Bursaphelenchus okinawaensis]|uniref:ML domain-containing protein n=1 Tax=Bursaphelenchus okinawaensis TaxID=465554 RepID=A0A811K615_9BILA|nr:unnamed protein product [Bursaphelenchus okinawaensis]CAG9092212.1 unnamed protein product [Bursaphelenchus okinawaensis]